MYVQLKFVMKHNARTNPAENMTMPGWFIDDFRIGNPLPQSGWMTIKGFTPKQSSNPGFPDGYGLLNLEQVTSPTNSLKATLLRGGTTEVVVDTNGNQLTGLEGPIIELWDVNSSEYPVIDLKLEFDTGQYRLSTSLHAITMGTRIGTGFNDSSQFATDFINNGVWDTPGGGDLHNYSPEISTSKYGQEYKTTKFSKPIVSVTPVVIDDCNETSGITVIDQDQNPYNLTVGQKWIPTEPIFRLNSIIVTIRIQCSVSEVWFDLEFGHNALGASLDIADDGDLEWAMNEPAFDHFGRQTKFWAGISEGINYAMEEGTATINLNGEGTGGSFMLPVGANIQFAEVSMWNNTIGEFDISLRSGTQEYQMGTMANLTILKFDTVFPPLPLKDAISSLMSNPLVQPSHVDEFGNEWIKFDFKVSNQNASTNSGLKFTDLDILYSWSTTISENEYFDRELNQGISLGTGNQVSVPIAFSASSGGAIKFSNLSVSTSPGYDSTLVHSWKSCRAIP